MASLTITGPTLSGAQTIWTAETEIPAGETINFDIERTKIGALYILQKSKTATNWKRGLTVISGEGDIGINFNLTNDATNADLDVKIVSHSEMTTVIAE